MPYTIEFAPSALRELSRLRAFDHRRVLESIEQQLIGQPDTETRNRKCLGDGLTADFQYVPPLWELRIGEFRAFYEIDAQNLLVVVLAVRRKPPDKTTAEVVNEDN